MEDVPPAELQRRGAFTECEVRLVGVQDNQVERPCTIRFEHDAISTALDGYLDSDDHLSGDPIAVYANYAVHGVVMYLAHTQDGHIQITGDLPGATSNYVEDRLENNMVALWTSGAAGDQNPLFTLLDDTARSMTL